MEGLIEWCDYCKAYHIYHYNEGNEPRGWYDEDGDLYLEDTPGAVDWNDQRDTWREYLEGVRDGDHDDYLRELLPGRGKSVREAARDVLARWDTEAAMIDGRDFEP